MTGSKEDVALAPQAWFESQEISEIEQNELHPEKLWLALAFVVLLPGSTKAPVSATAKQLGNKGASSRLLPLSLLHGSRGLSDLTFRPRFLSCSLITPH